MNANPKAAPTLRAKHQVIRIQPPRSGTVTLTLTATVAAAGVLPEYLRARLNAMGVISMEIMTTPQSTPLQTLQPVSDEKNLLVASTDDAGASCCGGGCCSS